MTKLWNNFFNKIDVIYVTHQEFYALVIYCIIFLSISTWLMAERVTYNQKLEPLLSNRNLALSAYNHVNDTARQMISRNVICQWQNINQLNEVAIQAVTCRYDSVQVVYDRLISKGWKFESRDQFERDHMPKDWSVQVEKIIERQNKCKQNLLETNNEVISSTMTREGDKVLVNRVLRWLLYSLTSIFFPLRWIYIYWFKKKGVRMEGDIKPKVTRIVYGPN
jgi:hypothetical protein